MLGIRSSVIHRGHDRTLQRSANLLTELLEFCLSVEFTSQLAADGESAGESPEARQPLIVSGSIRSQTNAK
jgi:hypothetical protein